MKFKIEKIIDEKNANLVQKLLAEAKDDLRKLGMEMRAGGGDFSREEHQAMSENLKRLEFTFENKLHQLRKNGLLNEAQVLHSLLTLAVV